MLSWSQLKNTDSSSVVELQDNNLKTVARQSRSSPARNGRIVFDTETTGLVHAIVVQLYYKVYDCHDTVLHCEDSILAIFPEDFPSCPTVAISEGASNVTGLTEDIRREKGVEPRAVLTRFMTHVWQCQDKGGVLVGHNVAYDIKAVENTIKLLWPDYDDPTLPMMLVPYMCTQEMATGLCQYRRCKDEEDVASVPHALRTTWAGEVFEQLGAPMEKWPKLVEVGCHLNIEIPEGHAHDASWDTEVTDLVCHKLMEQHSERCTSARMASSCRLPPLCADESLVVNGLWKAMEERLSQTRQELEKQVRRQRRWAGDRARHRGVVRLPPRHHRVAGRGGSGSVQVDELPPGHHEQGPADACTIPSFELWQFL